MFLRDIGLVDRSRIEIEDVSDDISESSKVKSTGEILKFNENKKKINSNKKNCAMC